MIMNHVADAGAGLQVDNRIPSRNKYLHPRKGYLSTSWTRAEQGWKSLRVPPHVSRIHALLRRNEGLLQKLQRVADILRCWRRLLRSHRLSPEEQLSVTLLEERSVDVVEWSIDSATSSLSEDTAEARNGPEGSELGSVLRVVLLTFSRKVNKMRQLKLIPLFISNLRFRFP